MTIDNFKSLLDNAAILASKLDSDRVNATKKYLADNGISVTFTAACMFLLGRNVSLMTQIDIDEAFGDLPEDDTWLEELQEFVDEAIEEQRAPQANWMNEQEQ